MTFDEQVTEKEDFHEKLMRLIDEGQSDEAMELLFSPDYDSNRMIILSKVAVDVALAINGTLSDIQARARILFAFRTHHARAVALADALAPARDLAGALVRAFAPARDPVLAGALAGALTHALAHAHQDSNIAHFAGRLSNMYAYSEFILSALERITGKSPRRFPTPHTSITITGIESLTVPILSSQLAPYLQALVDLQNTISALKDEPFIEPEIIGISKGSFITDIIGIGPAIEAFLNIIVPWRRKHVRRLAVLEEARREAEDREIRARAAKTRAEVKKIEAEAERIQMMTRLATDVITNYVSNLPPDEKEELVNRLLQPVGILATSPLELSAGESPQETPLKPRE